MNFRYKLIIILISCFINNVAYSNETLAYVDMDLIMNKSIVGKSISVILKKENESNIEYFKKREKELQNKEKKIDFTAKYFRSI